MSTLRVTFAACCAALSTLAVAQGPAGSAPPLWELGGVALGVSQRAYPGADQQVNRALALPYFVYRGDVLRADRDTAGIRAMKTETFELDVGFAGAFGAAFSRSLARDWNLFGFARLETVAGAANESSPLVRRSSGASVGVGVAYTWMRSDRAAFD